ncbi:uncharacterized protein KY384_008759 [Bacidia gigantensis]|uniref:uncharacterized protein n=1 Tax=Bacidia gigantensis TaxID=2732470 RepID=UPI001D054386|nr:uncharacterized protein KY384_008759 [Bacidia gigantensis]KAG8526558.1 hypothetical protein KY384_008759 [Bacidia gigantensis]
MPMIPFDIELNIASEPYFYWNYKASTIPEAQALASDLGLRFPVRPLYGIESATVYPIRRLIITNEASPESYELLLGPLWMSKASHTIQKTRMEVLLYPAAGSLSYNIAEELDEGTTEWNPRGPTDYEKIELDRILEIAEKVDLYMSYHKGGEKEVSLDDMTDIWLQLGGGCGYPENFWHLQYAIDARDQGL